MKGNLQPDHRTAILELLHERGPLPRADLVALTGLSPATVSRALEALRRGGFVREVPVAGEGPGRPALHVELVPDAASVVGIDAGGSMLRGVLADIDGTIRHRVARPPRDPRDCESLIEDLVSLARDVLAGAPDRRVLAAAAGVSGIVDHASGRVRMSPDLPGLDGVNVAARLGEALGIPVTIDNDDVLAAVGEAASGAARGATNVVFLSLGYGLGAGILVDGRPVRGSAHAAGSVGLLGSLQLDERASGRAIPGRYAAALLRAGRGPDGGAGAARLDARVVFERAAAGEPIARGVIADVVAAIAELATDVAAILDPSVIVLGGGLAANGPFVLDAVADRLRATVPFPPRVVPSALEDAAVVHGAVALALAHARTRLPGGSGGPGGPDTLAIQSGRARRRTALQLV
jgi:glucokinase